MQSFNLHGFLPLRLHDDVEDDAGQVVRTELPEQVGQAVSGVVEVGVQHHVLGGRLPRVLHGELRELIPRQRVRSPGGAVVDQWLASPGINRFFR